MKNLFKKISALVLAAIMVLTMCSAVFADINSTHVPKTGDTGKITVDGLEAGDSVDIYKIVKADYDELGNGLIGYSEVLKNTIADVTKPTTTEIANLINNKISELTLAGSATVESEKTTVEFDNLAVGMYLIKVTAGNGSLTVYNPMIASIYYKVKDNQTDIENGTVSAADNWALENGFAYAKSSKDTTPGKDIVDNDGKVIVNGKAAGKGDAVAKGDTVNYKITLKVPSYDPQYYTKPTYVVTDELSVGLDFVDKTQENLQNQADAKFGKGKAIVKVEGRKVTITLDENYILSLANKSAKERTFELKYSAKLNGTSVNFDASTNTVKVNYSNKPGDTTNSGETKTYHYTFKFDGEVKKIDENNKPLSGAVFGLFTDAECKNEAKYADTNKQITAESAETTGLLNFTGLDDKEYYMKEISAPKGYKLNNKVYKIEFKPSFEATGKMISYKVTVTDMDDQINAKITEYKLDANGTVVVVGEKNTTEISNTKLGSLPSTGGMGTYLFTIVGVVLMTCAAGAFFVSRRKANK